MTHQDLGEIRTDLAAAFRLASRYGLSEGICNHFSCRVLGRDDAILINPFGLHWSEMRASDLVVVDVDGNVLEGDRRVEKTAACIHGSIHRHAPQARVVMHTHMPFATALSCLVDGRLEPVHQNSLRFHGAVAYDEHYGGLVHDREEGERIAATLGDHRILFLANHGVIVAANSVHEAFDDLYYLEQAARVQVLAMQTGKPLKLVSDNVANHTAAQCQNGHADYAHAHFEALKRTLDREGADYAG